MTALCALMGSGASVAADDYPSRPLRLVLGFTAGGPTDIPARFLAERLSASLGKPVMVESKPGAGALLAALDVLSRPRDGHDLLLCTYFDAVNTLLYRNPKYKLSDIVGISLIAKYSYAVAASHSVPAQSFNELIEYQRRRPDLSGIRRAIGLSLSSGSCRGGFVAGWRFINQGEQPCRG